MRTSRSYAIKKIQLKAAKRDLRSQYPGLEDYAETTLEYSLLNVKEAWIDLVEALGVYRLGEAILSKIGGKR